MSAPKRRLSEAPCGVPVPGLRGADGHLSGARPMERRIPIRPTANPP